ncbi:MAG: Stk1 family PASTA domain-containing Ser/Thr kinase [Clostridia bacterium]
MIGTVLDNRYELVEKVGVGGMAIVYKAMDRLLNRYVAVKLLRSEFRDNEEFIRRFNIESQAAASLSHPNIVPIYDVGQSGEHQYIVMEFIEGKTLKNYIDERKGNIYWKEAVDISMQICSALEHAHSKHIIHRDIKPQNIMISNEGNIIKVMDFGIARAANNGTMTMEAIGSAHYLSPEQARGGYTDQRSDIYSLGIVMYELFTGKLPFDGETPVAVAMQHVQKEPVKPRNINPDIPKSVENIILKAMSKEQRYRYESATQMLSDIKKVYADPDSTVAEMPVEDDDKFGTRKIPPIITIDIPVQEKPVVRRSGAEPETPVSERKTKKKSNKKNVTTIVAAVITCFVIAALMGFGVMVLLNNPMPSHGETPVKMQNLTHLTYEQAQEAIKNTNLEIVVADRVYNADYPEGTIISQIPPAGDTIEDGSEVYVVISRGTESFKLRDYTGEDPAVAIAELNEKGITDVRISEDVSDSVEKGLIIRQFPSADTYFKAGDPLTIFVSSGSNTFSLGSYVGQEKASTQKELEEKDVTVVVVTEYSDTVPSGIVTRHEPSEGAELKKGDSVTIYVSNGVEQIKVPDLVGLDEDKARNAIANNKLKLGEVKTVTSGNDGLVVRQSITPGTVVQKGTVIDIYVGKNDSVAQGGYAPQTSVDGL